MTRTRSTKAARQKATKKHRSPTVTTAALVGGVGAAGLLLVVARRARASRALRAGEAWDADVLASQGAERG